MRFAFVTTEFATTGRHDGGLATHVARMARLLAGAGHEVTVFVQAEDRRSLDDWNGCRVRHVARARPLPSRLLNGLLRLFGQHHLATRRYFLANARALAEAVEAAHGIAPFDVVHSADHRGIGLAIPARPGRLRVVRCSAAMDLYMACDGRSDRTARVQIALEQAAIAGADLAFAPSRAMAGHLTAALGREVAVLRPPAYAEVPEAGAPPAPLPPRYLLHFAGGLIARKGTDLVGAALALALDEEPGLQMLWVGRIAPAALQAARAALGPRAGQLIWHDVQPKPALYALIRGAACCVLPSRVDNLPNTVIESLMLGVPVIGSTGSSIEEMVEPGVTGALVENGSVTALAAAMVSAWRGEMPQPGSFDWFQTDLGRAFAPQAALQAYLAAISAARGAGGAAQPKGTTA